MKTLIPVRRAGTARACVPALALLCTLLAPHAGATTTPLKAFAAKNAAMALPPALPLDDLQRRSRLRDVKISPDGSKLAYLASDGPNLALYVVETKGGAPRQLLANTPRAMLSWSGDGGVVFLDGGNAVSAVNLADGAAVKMAVLDSKLEQRMLAVDPSNPQKVLVEENDRKAGAYRLFRLGIDGQREPVYEGEKKVRDILLDAKGAPAFIKTLDSDYSQVIAYRKDGKWEELTRCKPVRTCTLVSSSPDGRKLTMAIPYKEDRRSLVQFDVQGKAMTLLHTDPKGIADLQAAVLAPLSQQPLLASYDLPTRRHFGLTASAQKVAADIGKKFGDANIAIQPSEGKGPWLMTETASNLPQERYWLYDQAARNFTEVLADERSKGKPLPEQHLAAKLPFSYKATDGMTIHGYLTLPPGRDSAKVPMLTMVHGGPWARFDSEYHSLVQWLANRGVAVFQPNFRASTGYGDRYMLAAGEDFGNGRVQKDIIEGVEYLLANGIGDRNKLAIMGDSFGGYSTLQALTHTPELFQFGMATVPPPDFARTMQAAADADKGGADTMPFGERLRQLGIRYNDAAAMKPVVDGSPAANVARVTKPLLILAGAKDDKVDIAAVTAYVAQLQSRQREVTLLVDPDEGHNPRKPILRQAYLYLLESMLHKHLGLPAPAAPSPEMASYLKQTMK